MSWDLVGFSFIWNDAIPLFATLTPNRHQLCVRTVLSGGFSKLLGAKINTTIVSILARTAVSAIDIKSSTILVSFSIDNAVFRDVSCECKTYTVFMNSIINKSLTMVSLALINIDFL